MSDLETFDREIAQMLRDHVLAKNITAEYAEAIGLAVDGYGDGLGRTPLTNDNKRDYVCRFAWQRLVGSRTRQLCALRRGFNVFGFVSGSGTSSHMLRRFAPADLRSLLMGPADISAEMVLRSIDWTRGVWPCNPACREAARNGTWPPPLSGTLAHLWTYISKELSGDASSSETGSGVSLRDFLRFITGSPTLPCGGLADGNGVGGGGGGRDGSASGVGRMLVQMADGELSGNLILINRLARSGRLPIAHTCFNTLDLPDYNDYGTLKAKFDQALTGDDGHFDML